MKYSFLLTAGIAVCAYCSGCATADVEPELPKTVEARYSAVPVNVDGVLDDAVWQEAEKYPLLWNPAWGRSKRAIERDGAEQLEHGWVRAAWDDKYVYAAFECTDSDVIVLDTEDQKHLYLSGDLGEFFLKPVLDDYDYYWELYISPYGNKSTFFFPSPGHKGLPSIDAFEVPGYKVAAVVDGTLNTEKGDFSASLDRDGGWTGEVAVPIAELTKYGAVLDENTPWLVLFGRYNYNLHFTEPELSAFPLLPRLTFHDIPNYGVIRFVR